MTHSPINWRNHLIEFVIVTLGILIGFGLNSWNENRKEERQVDLYLRGIKEELIENREELKRVHPYHLGLLKDLREKPLGVNLTLSPGELSNSAWKLAENPTFKKHVDHQAYKVLSAAYQMHDVLISESALASQMMSESNVLGTLYLSPTLKMDLTEEEQREFMVSLKEGWIPIFESWTAIEKTYLERIEKALALWED
jgi:hypothetical protein